MVLKSRWWWDLTTQDFADIDAERVVAILPVGAVEQHGPHLPVRVDAAINAGIITRAVELMPADCPALVLPMMPVGKSDEHLAFPGTLTLSYETLGRVWFELGEIHSPPMNRLSCWGIRPSPSGFPTTTVPTCPTPGQAASPRGARDPPWHANPPGGQRALPSEASFSLDQHRASAAGAQRFWANWFRPLVSRLREVYTSYMSDSRTDAVEAHVHAAERIHVDDTTVPVLAKNKCRTGRLWGHVRDDRPFRGKAAPAVVLYYSPNREGEHPQRQLAKYTGIMQVDAYSGYNALYAAGRQPGPIIEAACWAHGRRKLFDLARLRRCRLRSRRCGASTSCSPSNARSMA